MRVARTLLLVAVVLGGSLPLGGCITLADRPNGAGSRIGSHVAIKSTCLRRVYGDGVGYRILVMKWN